MCDSMHETAATPSVSLAAVAMCVCVFSKTMYLDRQRYTMFWPCSICRPNTKTKISRTSGHTDGQFFFFLDVAIRNSLRSNKKKSVKLSIICNNYIARLVRKHHIRNAIGNKYAQRTCLIIKPVAKLSINHSIGRTHG